MSTKRQEMKLAARGRGCLGKAADDEPVFILRAQDILAPAIVDAWADMAEAISDITGTNKIAEARNLADAMRRWPTRKLPD